jgi:hypothetical protein
MKAVPHIEISCQPELVEGVLELHFLMTSTSSA